MNLLAQQPSTAPTLSPTFVPTAVATPSVSATPSATEAAETPVHMPTPVPSAAPDNEPQAAQAAPVSAQEIVTRLQIFLDQQNFGPGKIDGRWGEFTGKALAKYAKVHNLPVDATIYDKLDLRNLYPIYTQYTVQPDDSKWVGPTSYRPAAEAKFKKLLYGDLLEFVAER